MDHLLAASKLAARDVEQEFAEAHGLEVGRRRTDALEDAGDPQREFARLERLADIIVGPALKARDAALRLATCGQHQDRHARRRPQLAREFEPGLPRHPY